MPPSIRTSVTGRGWTLSLQRLSQTPAPGHSANLGAAPLAEQPRPRRGVRRFAAALRAEERLWVAVTAAWGSNVTVFSGDGRTLSDEILAAPSSPGSDVPHRFSRIEGTQLEGLGVEQSPLTVVLGPRTRVEIEIVGLEAFGAAYGTFETTTGEPAVYAGWRLP